jgi:phosphatidylinositol alpha-mannosyltransferase
MRVALVCPYAWDRFGGVQTHVRSLSDALRRRGHEVRVFAPASLGREQPAERGVTIVGGALGIPINGSVAALSFGPGAATRVRRALDSFAPDVLHLHEPLIPSLSFLALVSCEVPAVGTFHASAEASVGYLAFKPVLELAAKRLSVRTAVSDAARELISRYFPGDYVLTPNGVDVARYASAEPADLGGGRTILFFSRLERRKGLEVLIHAVRRLEDLGDVRLVVGGSGPEEHYCRRLATRLGVRAKWLGRLPDVYVPSLYKAADVYCAPALGGESFGIVLVEAMAAGAPVVCSDLDGFRAVAAGAAELVPAGDPEALAAGLRRVVCDDARRAGMSKRGARLAGMFDWPRLVVNVESLYEKALAAVSA